jgi:hypothetical protein
MPANYPTATCHIGGMPRMMSVPGQYELIIEPGTTYILMGTEDHTYRRIFTDGRDWPVNPELTHSGVSIGTWIDEDARGRFNALEAETRGPLLGCVPTMEPACRIPAGRGVANVDSPPIATEFFAPQRTPLCANRGVDAMQEKIYSMTSSARASTVAGNSRPSAFAVFRLTIRSIFVDCWTGRSAGVSPLSRRPA